MKWLKNPAHYGIQDPRTISLCEQLCPILYPNDPDDDKPQFEPYFEADSLAEVGHAYETHVSPIVGLKSEANHVS